MQAFENAPRDFANDGGIVDDEHLFHLLAPLFRSASAARARRAPRSPAASA
jgi:hypothetical protein